MQIYSVLDTQWKKKTDIDVFKKFLVVIFEKKNILFFLGILHQDINSFEFFWNS